MAKEKSPTKEAKKEPEKSLKEKRAAKKRKQLIKGINFPFILFEPIDLIIMPKLYEYFGLIFLFYSNEHEPIHVHGRFQDCESKAEIIFENGKFKEIVISDVLGKKPLDTKNLKRFRKVVELYRDDIVRKWINFFVYNIEVLPEKITKKI